jgi:hypothetical protein
MRKLVLLTMVLFSSVLLTLGQECGAGETLINHADAQAGTPFTVSSDSSQALSLLFESLLWEATSAWLGSFRCGSLLTTCIRDGPRSRAVFS